MTRPRPTRTCYSVNQPVHYLDAPTWYVFSYGGDIANLANGELIAHEMGHNAGRLADQDTGSSPTYAGAELSAANVTALSHPGHDPLEVHADAGQGDSERAELGRRRAVRGSRQDAYSGRYRPTASCTMAAGDRLCPVCTNELEIRLRDIGALVPIATPLSPASTVTTGTPTFTWLTQAGVSHSMLEVESQSSGQLVASFDVYATSFTLTPPLPAATYRWRLRAGSTRNWANWSAWSPFTVVVAPPTISGLSPALGRVAGGTQVSISGSNFLVGATTVTVGGQPATSVAVTGDASLTAVVPPGSGRSR